MPTCEKCGEEVARTDTTARFWVLPEEVGTGRATFCSAGGIHEVADEEGP